MLEDNFKRSFNCGPFRHKIIQMHRILELEEAQAIIRKKPSFAHEETASHLKVLFPIASKVNRRSKSRHSNLSSRDPFKSELAASQNSV